MSFLDFCALMVVGTCGLIALALVLMHLPDSPLRSVALRATAGLLALAAPLYAVSPLDVMPDVFFPVGFADDVLVLVGGFAAARYALAGGEADRSR